MTQVNSIGLESTHAKELANQLNDLLANYQVFYQNTRGLHWNIRGEKFFELHAKFEEIYTDALVKIDEIAERILTLGHTPTHSFSEYIQMSQVKETTNLSDGLKAVSLVLDTYKVLILKQRELLKLAGEADDEGTSALMSDYIREQEKTVWMYTSFLGKR